jgi:hypothetical protein
MVMTVRHFYEGHGTVQWLYPAVSPGPIWYRTEAYYEGWGAWKRALSSDDIGATVPQLLGGQSVSQGLNMGAWQERHLGVVGTEWGVANQKFDINLPTDFACDGWIEVDLAMSWSYAQANGRLTKRFCVTATGPTIVCQDAKYVNADEPAASMMAISDLRTNGTNLYVTVAVTGAGNAISATIRRHAFMPWQDLSLATLSAVYIDGAALPKPSVAGAGHVSGTYIGNGTDGREIPLGFAPSAVMVTDSSGTGGFGSSFTKGGLAVAGGNVELVGTALAVSQNGFMTYDAAGAWRQTNVTGVRYHYIAFR